MGTEQAFVKKRQTLLAYRSYRERNQGQKTRAYRLHLLFDRGEYTELDESLYTQDPISFPGYEQKLAQCRQECGQMDALTTGVGMVGGIRVVACEMEPRFLMGSMGTVVGEKIARAADKARELRSPLIIFCASGGARMQEGFYSLLQMAKTTASVERFRESGGLFLSVLTHPTTGGVSASFASLGDIVLAEPGALIGFAGPRVIAQTIRQELPEGFQRAEYQQEHGFVDKIIPLDRMRETILTILKIHRGEKFFCEAAEESGKKQKEEELRDQEESGAQMKEKSAACRGREKSLSAYERLLLARDLHRPKITDYIRELFEDFQELAGDRLGREDSAVCGGIGWFEGQPVTVIGHRKGRETKENIACNFGMPGPEGYRKACRLMEQAEKFGRPVITFIDTPGAYPGLEAEERGISSAIAQNLAAMSRLRVPIVTVVTGEGNSGGALAIGMGDRVLMLENAIYCVLSPEGFSSILWKEPKRVREACEVMGITAWELKSRGLIDGVIREPEGGIQKDMALGMQRIRREIHQALEQLKRENESAEALVEKRYWRYRHFEGEQAPRLEGKKADG